MEKRIVALSDDPLTVSLADRVCSLFIDPASGSIFVDEGGGEGRVNGVVFSPANAPTFSVHPAEGRDYLLALDYGTIRFNVGVSVDADGLERWATSANSLLTDKRERARVRKHISEAKPLRRYIVAPPYTVGSYNNQPYDVGGARLRFANLPAVIEECSGNGPLEVTCVLPGDMRRYGQSTDAQHLPEVCADLANICGSLQKQFVLTTRIGWELDDRFFDHTAEGVQLQHHHEDDLEMYGTDITGNHPADPRPRPRADIHTGQAPSQEAIARADAAWLAGRRTLLYANQQHMQREALRLLKTTNLLVVGSPKVNPVMANLCDILFINHDACLGPLRTYIYPSVAGSRLVLRRRSPRGQWEEWYERQWDHRHIGWLHMIKNPWSENLPRFLIYLGGFYVQGTPAAMLKLRAITRAVAEGLRGLPAAGPAAQAERLSALAAQLALDPIVRPDYAADGGADWIPAHVVRARLRIPLNWFVSAPRPALKAVPPMAFLTPPSYEGSIAGYEDVLA